MGVLLQETTWSIFEEVWAKRNEILHGANNHTERAEMTTTTRRLLEYKRRSTELLSPHDQIVIAYPELTILNWTMRRKKNELKRLNTLHKAWKRDRQLQIEGQRRLYDFTGWQAHNPEPPDPGDTENETPLAAGGNKE